ncbi:MAG TPA: proton-conducting transporter membrane subunit, partial [Pirellulaceae bacterium]|nr:proton-conducting transporter membrane subunit [Pirellulaceae bacterium]
GGVLMNSLHFPWLEAATIGPLLVAAVISRVRDSDRARQWSVIVTAAVLVCTFGAWIEFALLGDGPGLGPRSFAISGRPLPVLAIDSLNAPLLPLTAFLYLLTAVATLRTKIRRFSFVGFLISLSLALAVLGSLNPWAIIALLAVRTIAPYLELRARHKPTRVYVLHMILFVSMLALGWWLVEREGLHGEHSFWAIMPLLIAVLVRTGSIPFHCWITDLFEHATFGTALLYVAPMMGAYVAIRLLVPIAPAWVLQSISIISLTTAVYAGGMALVQREARRFFCYILLSHSALVLVGLESLTPIGLTGALCVWLSVSLSLAGFGLVLRALEARHGRLSLVAYHGVYEHTPLLAVCFLLTGMASVGFPGTFGFLGTELLVDGAVQAFPYIGIAVVVAAALNGIAVVKAYFKLFTGTRHVSSVPLQVGTREKLVVLTLAALILGGGLIPSPAVESRHRAAEEILAERHSRIAPPATETAQNELPSEP